MGKHRKEKVELYTHQAHVQGAIKRLSLRDRIQLEDEVLGDEYKSLPLLAWAVHQGKQLGSEVGHPRYYSRRASPSSMAEENFIASH